MTQREIQTTKETVGGELIQGATNTRIETDIQKIAQDVKSLSDSTSKLYDTTKKLNDTTKFHQEIITNMLNEVRHSQGIVYLGFIILIVMMGAIIVEIFSNIWTKEGKPEQIPYYIYRN